MEALNLYHYCYLFLAHVMAMQFLFYKSYLKAEKLLFRSVLFLSVLKRL